jgi:hypothetical protein
MAEIFSGSALMPRSEMMNWSNIHLGTPKTHFSGLSLMPFSEFLESFLQVGHELVSLFGLDYDVIHVSLKGVSDEVLETLEHTTLVCSPYVFRLNDIVT